MPLSDPPIVGRPAVLWHLTDPTHQRMYCEVGEIPDGRVRVRIVRGTEEDRSETFPDAATAIRWAFDVQRAMVRDGWSA